jgi:hypothetical protein
VAVTIQFGAQAAQISQARLDSLDDGDLRANAKLGLGNPRVGENISQHKSPLQEQSVIPLPPSKHKGPPQLAFIKGFDPPLFSFVPSSSPHPSSSTCAVGLSFPSRIV